MGTAVLLQATAVYGCSLDIPALMGRGRSKCCDEAPRAHFAWFNSPICGGVYTPSGLPETAVASPKALLQFLKKRRCVPCIQGIGLGLRRFERL